MRLGHLALVTLMLGSSTQAVAEPKMVVGPDWGMIVPSGCSALIPRPPESPLYWDRWLSLAACLQDDSIGEVNQAADLAPLVKELTFASAPATMLYHEALGSGPETVQLRAAYHVGLLSVALITRARMSIHARDARTEEALRDQLEPLLEPIKGLARTAFGAVVNGAASSPEIASDPVNRRMVESAVTLLRALTPPHPAEHFDVARSK